MRVHEVVQQSLSHIGHPDWSGKQYFLPGTIAVISGRNASVNERGVQALAAKVPEFLL